MNGLNSDKDALKGEDGMADIGNPDQTASLVVCIVCLGLSVQRLLIKSTAKPVVSDNPFR